MKTRDIRVGETQIMEFRTLDWPNPMVIVTADGFQLDMDFNEAVLRASNDEWLSPVPF